MRAAIIPLVFVVMSTSGYSQVSSEQTPTDWHVYTNARYGYEIRYPDGLEVLPTGLEPQRDGRSIRISRKEFSAPTPMLSLSVGSDAAASGLPTGEVKGMTVVVEEIKFRGTAARQVTYRWTESDEIAFLEISLPGARFLFHANAGVKDVHETFWWEIIETFRFL